jgi:hypothetical protein
MDFQTIIYSILTSSLVTGGIGYLANKTFESKIALIEEKQKILTSINKGKYEIVLETLRDIWFLITEAEYYLKFEVLQSVLDAVRNGDENLNLDRDRILLTYKSIEQKSILVNPALGAAALSFFQIRLAQTYDEFIREINLAIVEQRGLDGGQNIIRKLFTEEYASAKQELRQKFETEASKILENL